MSGTRGRPLKLVALVVETLLAASLVVAAEETDQQRPNILFIYTDDQAPTAVGACGNAEIRTPHLDRLFREGAHLVNAFVTTPVCSPSRAGLIASRYGTEVGILDWINPRSEATLGLSPELVTWPELLARAGYRNGLVGKWHLGTEDRFHPTKMGYHEFMGLRAGGTKASNPRLEVDGVERGIEGFTADILTDHAIAFLEKHRERPFLLSLHFRAPHSPWLPVRPEDLAPFRDLDPSLPDPDFPGLDVERVKRMTREYYASVASVDRNVGRLLARVDALGLRDRTVVVFTSDHGYNLGHKGLWFKGNAHRMLRQLPEKRWPHIPPRRRPNLFDQSLRVPTAVRWPGRIKPGTVIRRTVTNLDWYPTMLDIAGVGLPAGVVIRGRSILPLLLGEQIEWDDDLYAEYSMRHGATTDMRGWRTPEWKLVIDFKNEGRVELYDLVADPGEKHNLAASSDPRAIAARKRLEGKIRERMRELGDPAVGR